MSVCDSNYNPLISIIVPAHNAENTIRECLLKLLNQPYDNIEIVVVENASTDNTSQIVGDIEKLDKRVVLITTDKIGVSNARNLGLKSVHGDIVGFCDADDFYELDTLENVVKALSFGSYDVVILGIRSLNLLSHTSTNKLIGENKVWDGTEFFTHIMLDNNVMGSVCNKFYRKGILKNCFFECSLKICEDTFFNVGVFKENTGLRSYYCNAVGYNYVNNAVSATHSVDKLFFKNECEYIRAMDKIAAYYSLTNTEIVILNSAKWILACHMLNFEPFKEHQIEGKKEKIKNLRAVVRENLKCYLSCDYFTFQQKLKAVIKTLYYLHR